MINRFNKGLIAIVIATLLMGLIALPQSAKDRLPGDPVSTWIKSHKVTLGLDLQGGTQLDYRIDLSNATAKNEDGDKSNDVKINDLIEGVRTTIERRVNSLGVSEPQIYTSNVAGESHIIVELAGIKDLEEAKKIVGKTIQLEFKEQKTAADPDETAAIRKQADAALAEALKPGASLDAVGKTAQTSDKKVVYRPAVETYESALPEHYRKLFTTLKAGEIYNKVLEGSDGYSVTPDGQLSELKGLFVVQLLGHETKDHTTQEADDFADVAKEYAKGASVTLNNQIKSNFSEKEAEAIWATAKGEVSPVVETADAFKAFKVIDKKDGSQVKASHILIAYKGALRADPKILRTKDQAQKRAQEVLDKAKAQPDNFADLAKEYTDDPTGKTTGGDLGFFGPGQMTKAFEDAAFALEPNMISGIVETEFGFHIIKSIEKKSGDSTVNVDVLSIAKSTPDAKAEMDKALARTKPHDVTKKEEAYHYNEIYFNTTPDPWKSTGLDGAHFKVATVTYNQIGAPQVSILFDDEGAKMFEDLTGRLVGKPLAIFVGGDLISAPNVQTKITGGSAVITGNYNLQEALKLANDLNTGAIDAPIILSGEHTISATLGEEALHVSVKAGLIGLIFLVLFMVLYYRLLGVFAVLALCVYSVIIVFLLNIFPLVMTLAGVAGIILSIGMAVDANILIFERTREELNDGKPFAMAIELGFDRAWSSIRDSNVSSLITCIILWSFGNSIIRGFALMLALGIVVSMFTAISVTRTFLHTIMGTRASKSRFLMGAKDMAVVTAKE